MQCECPDYKARKQTCKHLFAAMLVVKNRGKQGIENLEAFTGNVPHEELSNLSPKMDEV